MADTIAFVATYSHPSRFSVEQMLREVFPEFRLEVISLQDVVKQHKEWVVPNLWQVAKQCPMALLRGKAAIRQRYMLTPYLFQAIRRAMNGIINPKRHVFSFQTQSLHDLSVPGIPHFVYTDHTHLSNLASPYFDRRKLRSPQWIALERTVYANAATVFTRSSNISTDVVSRYGIAPEKVVCAHFGINAPMSGDSRLRNDGYSNKRILFVGRDWERKGGPQLAQAFERVLAAHPTARLVIVGASPKLTLPNCDVLGDQPIEKLSEIYAEASVYCGPSLLEPFGVSFLEAMMHGLPVVATRTGALPDIIENGVTGTLVPTGDSDAVAQALIELLDEPALCRQYGEAGRARALGQYSWHSVGARIRDNVLAQIPR